MTDNYDYLLKELGKDLGLEALEADEQGYCGFVIDNTYVLHLQFREAEEVTKGKLGLFVEVGQVKETHEAALYRQFLEAHYRWKDTAGATFALHPQSNQIILGMELAIFSLEYHTFLETLKQLLNIAEEWGKKLLDEGEHLAEKGEKALEADDFSHGMKV